MIFVFLLGPPLVASALGPVAIPQGTNRFASRLKNTSSLTAAAHSISAR